MMQEYLNEVAVRGSITGINKTAKETFINLVCKSADGVKNYPTAIFPKSYNVDGFKVGDNVSVFGYIQNHHIVRDNGKDGSKTAFIGEEIYRAKRALCDYFTEEDIPTPETGGYPDDKDEVIFIGDVVQIYTPKEKGKNFSIVKAACKDNVHKGQCDMVCFARLGAIAKKLKPGDKVVMVGYLTTENQTIKGQKITIQNIVCKDICKLG